VDNTTLTGQSPLRDLPRYFVTVRDMLACGWSVGDDNRALVETAIGHALEFDTWRSLIRRQELTDSQTVGLMTRLVVCMAAPK
jgi:hypothetical protein